jgi:hypothetical protein
MALKYSTAARNYLNEEGSYKRCFQNGRIEIYSGAQPATADAAVTGTLLCTITSNSLARTAEVLSTGTLTLSTGASGSVNTLTVNGVDILGGAVNFITDLPTTAAAVAAQINNFMGFVQYSASSSGAVVTISAIPGTGASPNTFVVAATYTTITGATGNMAGGVTAVNGLQFGESTGGTLVKLATQVWSGVNVATGTAGWYRQYGSVADAGAIDTNLVFNREDGAISTAGAELNMASTALTIGATTTISGDSYTTPTL